MHASFLPSTEREAKEIPLGLSIKCARFWDFPGGTVVKNPPTSAGDAGLILVQEDPTCHGTTKPVRHNCWACALEPTSHNYWAHAPQLLKPAHLEPMLHNKRSHCNEKATHRSEE